MLVMSDRESYNVKLVVSLAVTYDMGKNFKAVMSTAKVMM